RLVPPAHRLARPYLARLCSIGAIERDKVVTTPKRDTCLQGNRPVLPSARAANRVSLPPRCRSPNGGRVDPCRCLPPNADWPALVLRVRARGFEAPQCFVPRLLLRRGRLSQDPDPVERPGGVQMEPPRRLRQTGLHFSQRSEDACRGRNGAFECE